MDIDGYNLTLYVVYISLYNKYMGSVATFMIVLIMKLMAQIKLCVIKRYGNIITYKTR